MVGVAGKYKGCETCRRRRVKCSNERPFCQTCIGSRRTCEGYERERVFITGTLENRGRVASHPKKSMPPRRPKASSSSSSEPMKDEGSQITPSPPLASSTWDEYSQSSHFSSAQDAESPMLLAAMPADLTGVVGHDARGASDDAALGFYDMDFSSYAAAANLQPVMDGALDMDGSCIVRQRVANSNSKYDSAESCCAFSFEHDGYGAPAKLTTEQMASLGPRYFAPCPQHYFFVRVYRPVAVSLALIGRRETFFASPEWLTVPWEQHDKSLLDQLFDIILQLPALFAQADQLIPLQATLARQSHAIKLLRYSLMLESRFSQWLQEACEPTEEYPYPFWAEETRSSRGAMPFAHSYAFRDTQTSLMFLYYWMSQIPFHRCIETLHSAIFEPVVDGYSNMWADLAPDLQIDPSQYTDGGDLAANICQGLDSALAATLQPDMLVAPMTVALDFYRDVHAKTSSQDGVLELLWLDSFKKRLASKSQAVVSVLQVHRLVEITKF